MCGVVGLVLVTGCHQDDGGSDARGSRPPTAEDDDAAGAEVTDPDDADDPDAAVVRAYVEAMGAGDVDRALRFRCQAGRPALARRERFERDLGRLVDASGELGVGRIEVSDRAPRVGESLQGRHAVELNYWMTLDGDEVAEPLVGIVVDEDGERRLCTFATGMAPYMDDELSGDLADLGAAPGRDLAALLPVSLGSGCRSLSDEAMDASTLTGPLAGGIEGWTRSWQEEPYGGVTMSALRFPSEDIAMAAARTWMFRVEAAATQIFAVPGVPEASGVRFLGFEWLWLQPPAIGPYIDEVSMVFGDVYVNVAIGVVTTGEGHEDAIARAQEVARLARG
jgi:hypothetical protein